MIKLVLLAALVAVCSAGYPNYKVGYGFVAAGYGHHPLSHGSVAKVNAVQTGHHYNFNVDEKSPHGHRYHYQTAFAPTLGHGYGLGYGHGGHFGGHGFAGGHGGFGHGGFY